MQKNKNRTGLALGAIAALVSSLFVLSAPAQASETSVVAYPKTGLSTQLTTVNGNTFDLSFRHGTGVSGALSAKTTTGAGFGYVITKPEGVTVSTSVSALSSATMTNSPSTGTSFTTGVASSLSGHIIFGLPDRTSVSAAVSITITPFLDIDNDRLKSNDEPSGTPVVLTFLPWSALGATVSVAQPLAGDNGATASFAVTANTSINWAQLASGFLISVSSTADKGSTNSAAITGALLSAEVYATASNTANSNYSSSFTTNTAVFTTSGTVNSLSAVVWFKGEILVASQVLVATGLGVSALTLSPVTGPNAVQTNNGTGDVRINSAFSLKAYPYSASITTSVAIASAFTVSSTTLTFDADSGVILNGVTYTSKSAFVAAGFTLAAGTTTIPMSTFGQDSEGNIVASLTSQLKTIAVTLTVKGTEQVVVATPAVAAGLAGAAKTFAVTAKDQWGVTSVRTDQRIAASVVLGGSTSTTVSAALVNGAASIAVTPTPATRTGSAVVTFTLQSFNQSTQQWDNATTGTFNDTSTWNVYTYAAGTDSITSRTVSKSASISYGVALSWSETIAVVIANSFSDVVASAPGLMIQNADSTTVTASDVLTIAANGKTANFRFTSRLAGTYTVTFTNGTATTTSTIIVDVAGHDSGATLTFDKASIAAGTTTTVTGTLKDANGNPVMTSGSSDVSVAWSGKGLPFGNATNMETDANGQLTFYVLVLSGEMGDAAISATYKPAGLTVSTKNISVVHAVAVGKAAASAAADQKITIGTYKGYVAVFTKGYAGQKLSVQVASKWHVRNSIVDLKAGYSLLTVNTGAGYVANVIVYIDGVEVERMTITTK